MKGVIGKNPRELDQFFTKDAVAVKCVKHLKGILSVTPDCVVEPSFGEGAFIKAILSNKMCSKDKLIYVDIDSSEKCHRYDFLKDDYVSKKVKKIIGSGERQKKSTLTIGNPPFGKKSSLAISFFNKAAEFSDIIAFIIPRTFCKQSVQNKLNRKFFLIDEYNLLKKRREGGDLSKNDIEYDGENNGEDGAFTFKGKSYNVPCVFQIWSSSDTFINKKFITKNKPGLRPLYPRFSKTKHFTFVPYLNPLTDLAIRRIGVNAGRIFDKNPEKCSKGSHLFLRFDTSLTSEDKAVVLKNLKALNLENLSSKYNTAGCPSISKTELCNLYTEKYFPSAGK